MIMRQKVLSILALLCLMAVSGARAADTYTVTFSNFDNGNLNVSLTNVTLPMTFSGVNPYVLYPYNVVNGDARWWKEVSVTGGDGKVSASASETDPMSITITGAFEGTATILCSVTCMADAYYDASRNVYVTCVKNSKVDVTGVTLSQTEASLDVSETLTLTATVAPDNATDKTVTWTTSDASVVTVANGVVTAVGAGTATITATATNGTDDTSDDFSATCTVTVTDPATKYDLTLADGSSDHGTVAFTVGGNAATQAKKDDVVTVSVTPADGYSAKDVTVRAYTSWEAASDVLTGGGENPGLVSDVNVAKQENGTWSFTMPEANVWVVVTYAKNLQDAWIQAIADHRGEGRRDDTHFEHRLHRGLLEQREYWNRYRNRHRYG